MWREIWVGLAVCAGGVGCTGPQYYTPPPDRIPAPSTAGGAAVQVIDQRPEWEKKPFTGVVCLYHLDKAHPDKDTGVGVWEHLAKEADAVVAAMPQKPERVEVVVTSFRLVRSPDSVPKFRDYGAGLNPNPNSQLSSQIRANDDERQERLAAVNGANPPTNQIAPGADVPPNRLEMLFASKDDPRRMLKDHPAGASCALQAKVRLVFPGGREQVVDVKTLSRGTNDTHTSYMGEAMDCAARAAVFQFGRQFRSGVGLNPDP